MFDRQETTPGGSDVVSRLIEGGLLTRIISISESPPGLKQAMLVAAAELWGSRLVVTRGRLWDIGLLDGFIAVQEDGFAGGLTYRLDGGEMELVTLNSEIRFIGVGGALLSRAVEQAKRHFCRRIWLITTNDNLDALRFYQRRGFRLAAIYPGAIGELRKIKPSIPMIGEFGIEICDEIELEMLLT